MTFVDPFGVGSTNVYDHRGRVTERFNAIGEREGKEYDLNGNLIATIDPLGRVVEEMEYDENGQEVRSTVPLGVTQMVEYDRNGRQTRAIFEQMDP